MKLACPIVTNNISNDKYLILKELKYKDGTEWEKAFLVCDLNGRNAQCYLAEEFLSLFDFNDNHPAVIKNHPLNKKKKDCKKWLHKKLFRKYAFLQEVKVVKNQNHMTGVLYASLLDDELYVREISNFMASFKCLKKAT